MGVEGMRVPMWRREGVWWERERRNKERYSEEEADEYEIESGSDERTA
jgi:hypothetical protein